MQHPYNQLVTLGPIPISQGNYTLNVADSNASTCTTSTSVTAPPVCSEPCNIQMQNLVIGDCNDNNTGPNSNDDFFSITFKVVRISGSINRFNATVNGKVWSIPIQ